MGIQVRTFHGKFNRDGRDNYGRDGNGHVLLNRDGHDKFSLDVRGATNGPSLSSSLTVGASGPSPSPA